jgi:hypothetical protein
MRLETHDIRDRLEKLERDNRTLKWLGMAAALFAASAVLMAQVRPNRTIQAERIIVRDSSGRARITIGTPSSSGYAVDSKSDDPLIWLSDEKGTDRAILGIDGLRFADEHGRRTANYQAH